MNAQLDFYDVEQNTDAWYQMRAGKITSSSISKIMANYGKAFADPAKRLAVDIATQRVTGKPTQSSFSNHHTERGHEQEPIARMLYEEESFCEVSNGGFFCNETIGCSPDGLVYDDGVIEIKSVVATTHYANVKRQGIDPAYKWQCCANLLFTGRKWIDFISYCEDFPSDKQLFVCRREAKDLNEEFEMISSRLAKFETLINEAQENIEKLNYRIY